MKVVCNGATDWNHLAAQQRFDPVTVWGYVLFYFDAGAEKFRPADYMHLSEQACWYLDQYWAAPPDSKGKLCRMATRIEFKPKTTEVRVVKRMKVKGRWRTKVAIVTKTQQVAVETPVNAPCDDYMLRVFSLQTLAHESIHLTGVADEAQAECQGMQRLMWLAQRFGASVEQARQIALDFYRDFYLASRPGTPYYLPGCPNPAG